MVLLSFAITIVLGAVLLLLPQSTVHPGSLSFCNALFSSTSATCVTGLTVLDTGSEFTLFGQLILLALIQAGGLGIMTISTFFMVLISGRLNIIEREILYDTIGQNPMKNLRRLLINVFIYTISLELIGSGILLIRFIPIYPLKQAIYVSVFHSVSAFCNAGFTLFPHSFIAFKGDWIINTVLCGLIVLGGLGFVVIFELISKRKKPFRIIWSKLSLHTRLVLCITPALILSGSLLFYMLEYNNVLFNMPQSNRIMISIFQSITSRTAGFNTIDIGMLRDSTLLVLIILMFIGASPGSCGGGIKTTTFVLFLLSIITRFRLREDVNLFGRRIPQATISKVTVILFSSLFIIIVFTFILLAVEIPGTVNQESRSFLTYLFEVVSAYGTVGLSMGATAHLENVSKFLVVLLMYIGRLGPLTLAIAIKTKKDLKFQFIEENVVVG
jgi:trk system potassium uptake protein TrkH